MNWVLFIHQLNMYWRQGNEVSAGLMMLAYYLTVNTNDSEQCILFDPHSCHRLHFHDHGASQAQIDGGYQFNKRVLFSLSDPNHTVQRHARETTIPHVYESFERQTEKPISSSASTPSMQTKGRSGKACCFTAWNRAGLGVNSVPAMKK